MKILFVVIMPFSAFAQDVVFSTDAVESCLEKSSVQECYGVSARACMENTQGGHSTPVMVLCLNAEQAYWEERLRDISSDLAQFLVQSHAEMPMDIRIGDLEIISGPVPTAQELAFRNMNREWARLSQFICETERLEWGDGTGKAPAYAECMMRMTAQRVAYLQSFR